MVYIASDYQLPTSAWDQRRPGFHVRGLAERDEQVRRQFSKSCIYYVGSHEGCGCGFQHGQHEAFEGDTAALATAQAALAAARDSRRQLAEFLSVALQRQPTVELFACWDGDQGAPPQHRGRLRPVNLLRERTFFREKELLVVSEQRE
jgi:hypothetical protein